MTTERKIRPKLLNVGSIIAVILVASLAGALAKLGVEYFLKSPPLTKEQALQKTVEELRKKLPMRIDENTTFTNVMADPSEMTLIYEYMIENTKITSEQQKSTITRALKKNLMKMCAMPKAFDYGVQYTWNYIFPISGEGIQIRLKESDCKK